MFELKYTKIDGFYVLECDLSFKILIVLIRAVVN